MFLACQSQKHSKLFNVDKFKKPQKKVIFTPKVLRTTVEMLTFNSFLGKF